MNYVIYLKVEEIIFYFLTNIVFMHMKNREYLEKLGILKKIYTFFYNGFVFVFLERFCSFRCYDSLYKQCTKCHRNVRLILFSYYLTLPC